jgi:hypothetical protein
VTTNLAEVLMLGHWLEQGHAAEDPVYREAIERALREATSNADKEVRVWFNKLAELTLTVSVFDKMFIGVGKDVFVCSTRVNGVYTYELTNGSALVLGTKSDEARYLAALPS